MMQQQLGKRKTASPSLGNDAASLSPTVVGASLTAERQHQAENSPSLMRFIRSLFRPGWEDDETTTEGTATERFAKKARTEPPPSPLHTTTTSASSRTHTKEVHQRRRRHKRTNSLSSLSQHSSQQVVVPVKRLDFSGRTVKNGDGAQQQSSTSSDHSRKPGSRVRSHLGKSSGAVQQHILDAQNGDNDGPYDAGPATTKRAKQSEKSEHDTNTKISRYASESSTGTASVNEGRNRDAHEEEYQRTQQPDDETGRLITSVAPASEVDVEDNLAAYDPYEHIRQFPPRPILSTERILLPRSNAKKPTLVLDLDETLVHSTIEPPPPGSPPCDHVFSVTLENITYNVFVRVRPNMHEFLAQVAELFEVVVFTASQEAYAGRLLDMLDTERHITYRLYRDACVYVEGNFVKDLSMLGRDLQRTIIIDNSPLAFAYHLDNGIPIESWFGERSDNHLLALLPFLRELARTDDVRPLIRKRYNTLRHRSDA